jgi:hypothetical protein
MPPKSFWPFKINKEPDYIITLYNQADNAAWYHARADVNWRVLSIVKKLVVLIISTLV